MTDGMSLSDIAAVTNNDGFGGGNGAWWLIVLFLFAWGRGGYGNDGGSSVKDQYVLSSDFATIQRMMDNGFSNQERRTDSIINGLCDGFYTQAQLANQTNMNIMQGNNAIQSQLAQCCCDVREGIAGVNYNLATQECDTRNTIQNAARDIVDNQNANTRAILDSLVESKLEAKNEKIQEQAQMISGLQLAASQSAQNQYLINKLQPAPVPAFNVPAPYAYSGCGCGC